MSLTSFFILMLSLIVILVIIFALTGVLKQTNSETNTPPNNQFIIPAPWYWLTKQEPTSLVYVPADTVTINTPEIIGVWSDGTYTFQFNPSQGLLSGKGPTGATLDPSYFGIDGKAQLEFSGLEGYCSTYTFLSSYPNVPSSGKYSMLIGCEDQPNGNGAPGACYKSVLSGDCYDDDQLLGIEAIHACAGQITFGSPTGDLCRGQDGQLYPINTTEIYFTTCTSSSGAPLERCDAVLGFLVLGQYGINATCITGPLYNISGTGNITRTTPLNSEQCSLTNIYKAYPNQLWRISPASYESGGFIYNPGGSFLRIYSRATGLCLSPSFNLNDVGQILPSQPIAGPLQLIACDTFTNSKGNIYWWYVTSLITQPEPYQKDEDGDDIIMVSYPQLVFISDPTKIPLYPNWAWLMDNKDLLSVQQINGQAVCEKIVIVRTTESGARSYIFSYLNYIHSSYLI